MRAHYFKSTLHFPAAATSFLISSNCPVTTPIASRPSGTLRPTVSSEAMLRISRAAFLESPWSRGPERYPLINLVTLSGVVYAGCSGTVTRDSEEVPRVENPPSSIMVILIFQDGCSSFESASVIPSTACLLCYCVILWQEERKELGMLTWHCNTRFRASLEHPPC